MEGIALQHLLADQLPGRPPACNAPELTLPILDYGHVSGKCSITGGYVYRGTQVPYLYGKYLFGDLCSGRLWWAAQNNGTWSSTAFTATASSCIPSAREWMASSTSARATGRCRGSDDDEGEGLRPMHGAPAIRRR